MQITNLTSFFKRIVNYRIDVAEQEKMYLLLKAYSVTNNFEWEPENRYEFRILFWLYKSVHFFVITAIFFSSHPVNT